MKTTWIGAVLLGIWLAACHNPQAQSEKSAANAAGTPTTAWSSFQPEVTHARHFTITVHDQYKSVIVKNPWSTGDTLTSYVLYPKGTAAPNVTWAEFTIGVPIDAVVATSSPHIGLIGLVGELDKITGVADDKYIYNAGLYERVTKGEVAQVGSLKDSNLEILLDLQPDLVMKTGYDHVRNEDDRLMKAGIPVSYNVEWMENNMLARAEWVKFIGAFFNKDQLADSIFRHIKTEYQQAIQVTANVNYRPAIMTGNNFKGTWYMPGADSYLTKLIHDAGGDYYYKNEQSVGSLPLSFEVVLDHMIDADFWIGVRAESLKELEMTDERYTLFKAFKTGNVYTFNKRISENGGNDYWETGMARPDMILKDVIKIFHPQLLPNHQLYYYKQLQ